MLLLYGRYFYRSIIVYGLYSQAVIGPELLTNVIWIKFTVVRIVYMSLKDLGDCYHIYIFK